MLLGLVTPTAAPPPSAAGPTPSSTTPFRHVGAVLEADAASTPAGGRATTCACWPSPPGCPLSRVDEVLERGRPRRRRPTAGSRASRSACASGSAWPRALLGEPEVLILDEPANGLDPEGVHWLRQFLRSFADDGGTVLVSSHLLAEVAQTVDDVVIIANGRLVTQSSLADLAGRRQPACGCERRRPRRCATRSPRRASPPSSSPPTRVMAFETTTDAVGLAAAGAGVVIYEMTHEHFDLEELFLELTTTEGAVR